MRVAGPDEQCIDLITCWFYLFYFSLHKHLFNTKLCMNIYRCILYPYIFFVYFSCIFWCVCLRWSTGVPQGAEAPELPSSYHRYLFHLFAFFRSPTIRIFRTFVTPQIIKSLVSIRHFTVDNNCSVEFDPFDLSVKDIQTKSMITSCNSFGDLYPLLPPKLMHSSSTLLWHRHLGHIGSEALSKLASNSGIQYNKNVSESLSCMSTWTSHSFTFFFI